MFTGIVQEVGALLQSRFTGNEGRLKIACKTMGRPVLGESIAVNGTCLTVRATGEGWFEADVMPRTWLDTNLGEIKVRDPVNLERALKAGDAMGGHIVSGHVDGVGTIRSINRERNAVLIRIAVPENLTAMMIPKGSVAVDGVSLTIQALTVGEFTVSLIPHTFAETRFGRMKIGAKVNIETDMLTKKLAGERAVKDKPGLTMELLRENGFA